MKGKNIARSTTATRVGLGTTISPYLLFWQSSQEVEEIDQKAEAKPLAEAPEQAHREMRRIRFDTFLGMAVSRALFWSAVINGFVAVPIMAAMTWVASQRSQMGRFTVTTTVLVFGWAATAVMAAIAMLALNGSS